MPGDTFPFPLLTRVSVCLSLVLSCRAPLLMGLLRVFPLVSRSFELWTCACFPGCPVTSRVRRPLVSCWLDVWWLLGRVADFLSLSADFRFLLLGVIFQHFESAAIVDVVRVHGWPRVVTEANIAFCAAGGLCVCGRCVLVHDAC